MDNQENKFDFSEEEEKKAQDKIVEESKEAVVKDAKGLITSSKNFLSEIFGFKQDTDRDGTIEAIKADIPFKGATAWILICSIFVASVGLNYNSTAVVIGAMLISPLMGPILGIGMSIAVNDIDTLRKSLINFAVMVVLSVLTAYLFFEFFPLRQDSSELLGRTRPDIRDVLIAFFGGLALIIARTKKGTIASVIFGVAIATALMPPLCTVGYGLAKGSEAGVTPGSNGYTYALGAIYLFTINTIFIALATFIVLKLLRFPMQKYVNSQKRRYIARLATLLALVVMIPAVWTFLKVLKESGYQKDYKAFIEKNITKNDELWLRTSSMSMKDKTIKLSFFGELDDAVKTALENELSDKNNYPNIYNFTPDFGGGSTKRSYEIVLGQLDNAYERLEEKDSIISDLNSQIDTLKVRLEKITQSLDTNDFVLLAKDAKIEFSDLQYFGYAKMLESTDFRKADTIAIARVRWNTALTDSLMTVREVELNEWLKKELKINNVLIKRN
ncbi:MAG: hypothetical protein DA407_11615 [Bacteroidetes bacterium]|nr:MAG: hypothetical protein DA407_11615 [Bacteroidota bacterium]